jgi:DNA recombination protein RmuC
MRRPETRLDSSAFSTHDALVGQPSPPIEEFERNSSQLFARQAGALQGSGTLSNSRFNFGNHKSGGADSLRCFYFVPNDARIIYVERMERMSFFSRSWPVPPDALPIAAAALVFVIVLFALGLVWLRARRGAERQRAAHEALERKLSELGQGHAELNGSLRTMAESLAMRQSDLARLVSERLDSVGARVGQGLEHSSRMAHEDLLKLGERLAVIDAAQTRLAGLTEEVVGLKDILANKQARGAFGQGRMEAIIRDCLPPAAFAFQHTLSNRSRPDCAVRLPGDARLLVIDAKFPLEAFLALKDAQSAEAQKAASTRVRADVGKHIRDISERYFIPGETQDLAILFVPSESLYADLAEHFEDVIQKAYRQRIIIVSPALLMMAVQVLQALVRDARVREEAHAIQSEVRLLSDDVGRLRDRVGKLSTHLRQTEEDVAQILISADKISRRGERIDMMDFARAETSATLTAELMTQTSAIAEAGR